MVASEILNGVFPSGVKLAMEVKLMMTIQCLEYVNNALLTPVT